MAKVSKNKANSKSSKRVRKTKWWIVEIEWEECVYDIRTVVENKFKVPKSVWDSWDGFGKMMFNNMYVMMTKNPVIFRHADFPEKFVDDKMWKVTARNVARIAASTITDITNTSFK